MPEGEPHPLCCVSPPERIEASLVSLSLPRSMCRRPYISAAAACSSNRGRRASIKR